MDEILSIKIKEAIKNVIYDPVHAVKTKDSDNILYTKETIEFLAKRLKR